MCTGDQTIFGDVPQEQVVEMIQSSWWLFLVCGVVICGILLMSLMGSNVSIDQPGIYKLCEIMRALKRVTKARTGWVVVGHEYEG